jgi:Excreted virulence factor EspC, type VII ESX diderm
MSGDLRVTTLHLGDLAVKQHQAAGEIKGATFVTEGVEHLVRESHGVIASATASAVAAIRAARRGAGEKVAGISESLSDKLTDAAARYDEVDAAMGGVLDGQLPR